MSLEFDEFERLLMTGTDLNRQKKLICDKVNAFEGCNIADFLWQCLSVALLSKQNEAYDQMCTQVCNVSLFGFNDKYVCAKSNGKVICNREKIGTWETFTSIPKKHGRVALATHCNTYLTPTAFKKITAKNKNFETFKVVQMKSKFAFQSLNKNYLSVQANGNLRCVSDIGESALFKVIVHQNNNQYDESKITDTKESEEVSFIDFEEARNRGNGMCEMGHYRFELMSEGHNHKCCQCKKVIHESDEKEYMYCSRCYAQEIMQTNCSYCKKCRLRWLCKHYIDMIKSRIVRRELRIKPELTLDSLCNLPRETALKNIISNVYTLDNETRVRFIIFLIDVDNLKALNSMLGYAEANKIIANVGTILRKYATKVNKGHFENLKKAYVFRQGGDEFTIILETYPLPNCVKLDNFFQGWKNEINALADKYKEKYKKDQNEMKNGIEALKQRHKQTLRSAVCGLPNDAKYEEAIALLNKGIEHHSEFKMDKIGISVGVFVPMDGGINWDWIECAEKAQREAKTEKGKNSISIYYQHKGLVPNDIRDVCLVHGVGKFMDGQNDWKM